MSKSVHFISKYAIPLFFFFISLCTLLADPDERLSTRLPIVPGAYQYEIAFGSAVIGLVLAFVIWRYQAKNSGSE